MLLCLASLAAAAAAPSTFAPPAPPAIKVVVQPAVDPARLAAADRLMSAMDYEANMTRMIDSISARIDAQVAERIKNSDTKFPAELGPKLSAVIRESIRDSFSPENLRNLRRGTALIYARRFDVAELNHLIERMPEMLADMQQLTSALVERERPTMEQKIVKLVTDYVQTHHD